MVATPDDYDDGDREDGDEDGGGCGSGLVLEADGVGEDLSGGEPILIAEAGGADDVVGVAGC